MEQSGVDLDSMRADYRLVRKWWRESEGWSEADLVEADECVKAAVDGGDAELIGCWANWLAGIANGIRDTSARVRAMEARMKEEARQSREGKAA